MNMKNEENKKRLRCGEYDDGHNDDDINYI